MRASRADTRISLAPRANKLKTHPHATREERLKVVATYPNKKQSRDCKEIMLKHWEKKRKSKDKAQSLEAKNTVFKIAASV